MYDLPFVTEKRWIPLVMEPPAGDEPSFVDLGTDFAFKRIFGSPANKELLIHFLQSLPESSFTTSSSINSSSCQSLRRHSTN